jgi:hypothetical protein
MLLSGPFEGEALLTFEFAVTMLCFVGTEVDKNPVEI